MEQKLAEYRARKAREAKISEVRESTKKFFSGLWKSRERANVSRLFETIEFLTVVLTARRRSVVTPGRRPRGGVERVQRRRHRELLLVRRFVLLFIVVRAVGDRLRGLHRVPVRHRLPRGFGSDIHVREHEDWAPTIRRSQRLFSVQ
jgi:hypothetical protein